MIYNIKNFLSYKSNRQLDPKTICIELKKIIDQLILDKNLQLIVKRFSDLSEIPIDVLQFDLKKKIFLSFQFSKGKFSSKLNLVNLLKDLIYFISFYFWIMIFSKKLEVKKKVDIIFDDLDNFDHLNFFDKLSKKFNDNLFIIKKKSEKKNHYHFRSLSFYNSSLTRKNFFALLFFFYSLLKVSIINRVNLFFLINTLIFRIYKYDKIFSEIKAKYLFSNKFFTTSSIKNFLFKKKGGIISACTQRNIFEFSISFYINVDILFCLGEGTTNFIEDLGAQIKRIVPIGSIVLENKYLSNYQSKEHSKIKNIDILNIGINYAHSYERSFMDDRHFGNYYRHIYWLKKISKKYSHLNIIIKHHDNNLGDKLEKKIIENSNVKIVVKSDNSLGTYGYLDNSKLITSFGSTMILEALSINKNCFFLDPKMQNVSFFESIKDSEKIRIKSYHEFENLVRNIVIEKKKHFINLQSSLYCKDSSNASDEIFKVLNNYKD